LAKKTLIKYSVVILTHENALYTKRHIELLFAISQYMSERMEIYLIDNNSSEEARAVLDEISEPDRVRFVRISLEKNEGILARNRVIPELSGEYIVFADNDVAFMPSCLLSAERFFKDDVGFVGAEGFYIKPGENDFSIKKSLKISSGVYVDGVSASFCMFRNQSRIEGFLKIPEHFKIRGYDDVYYSLYMKSLGWRARCIGWDNIGVHLGQFYRGYSNTVVDMEWNKGLVSEMFFSKESKKLSYEKEDILV
jgi:glycosyltransferase involved in cell wall biosynthesis